MVAGDVYRPAAIEQLKILGQQIGVEVYTEEGNQNPVQIAENAIKYARTNHLNTVIVDTAGRLAVDEQMMQEITAIKAAVKPGETLFVVDSMTGQDAVNTAKEFNDRLDFDGVVLTKLDGDTRGGAAISIRAVVNKPLKFISSGEKDGCAAGVPSRAYGRPYPRHGRHRVVGRKGSGTIRRGGGAPAEEKAGQKPVRLQRLPHADQPDQKDG